MNLPTGTVTFFFTDIEGSTNLARTYPETWESLRGRHDDILRGAIESNNGFVFQVIGDSFCSAFHKAGDALNAALNAQRGLQREPWGEAIIRVRMGIHTGEAETDGRDYRGYLTLSLIQRVMSAGHGGQILVSNATENLLRGQLPNYVTLRDMGEHKLKDAPLPVRFFQVVVPDLPSDFPALRALDVFPNNLPAQLTSFIGREKEMIEIKQAINEHRLVTLTGSGGTGKTRLSLQVAADLRDQFPDGLWFIELAPLSNPDLIPQTILSVFGIGEQQGRTITQSLIDHIHDRKLLILLDNCEHLIQACAELVDMLLSHSPGLRILASSREALGVKGEMAWYVPSLSLPNANHLPDAEQLPQYESVRLFIERATLVHPHFHVTKENASSIAQICSRLDGIPLALELAAARVKTLSVDQIAARLNDRFRLLTGGARTALPRQQTLHALIEWSYNLLSEHEQILFGRLAVFVGGWSLEAAEQVCVEERGGVDILDLLTRLVDKSLVIVDEIDNGVRYRMLETTRQFARDMLMMSDDMKRFRERHLDYYLNFVELAELELQGRKQAVWMLRLEMEHDNLRAALEWSLESRPEFGLRMAVGLVEFWDTHAHVSEARKWLEAVLNATSHLPPAPMRVDAILGATWLAARQSEITESQALLEEGIALAQKLGYKKGIAQGFSYWGILKENMENDLEQAEVLLNQALKIWRELGDKLRIGQALGPLALSAINRHDYARAESLFNESLSLFREVENEREIAGALENLSEVAIYRRDYESARALAEESILLYRELEDKHGIATAQRTLSVAVHNQGNIALAKAVSEQSAAIFREIGDFGCLGLSLSVLARQVCEENDLQRAAELIRESVKLLHDMGDKISESNSLNELGRITLGQGNSSEARKHFRDGLILQKGLNDARMVPSLLEGLAQVFATSSRANDATRLLGAATVLRDKIKLAMMQTERSEYDQLVSTLHNQVADAAYQKIWAEGRLMTMEQAIELALMDRGE